MKAWYIALLGAFIVLAGCGTEDNGTTNEDTGTNPQEEEVEENEQQDGLPEDEDTGGGVTNQESENQNGEGDNGTLNGETAYERGLKEFELEVDFQDNNKWEYEYEVNDSVEAEIEKSDGMDQEGTEDVVEEIENILQNVVIDDSRSQDEMIGDILNLLEISRDELEEFELEIDYEDGTKIQFEQNF
ncbi:YusW family protein [Virgibacillus kimchii]